MKQAPDQTRRRTITNITLIGAIVNCLLTIAKISAGIVGLSAALVADGIHSLSDLVSDFIVILFVGISSKEKDQGHNYGHGKYETLATLLVSLLLMAVGVKLCYNGVDAIIGYLNGESLEVPGIIALYMAGISIIAKEILYQITARVGKNVQSQVVIANAWHHRTDAISSIGSAIGIGGAIFLGNQWVILDPIAACVISVFIFIIAIKMAATAISELMEASLSAQEQEEIVNLIGSIEGIEGVHNLKTRRNGQSVIVDVHVVVNPKLTVETAHEMTTHAEELIYQRFGAASQIFIHVEPDHNAR